MQKILYFTAIILFSFTSYTNAQCGKYLVFNNSPWGQTGDQSAMNTVFGSGNWVQASYNTSAAAIFSPSNCFVMLEGSEVGNAIPLNNMLAANHTLIENWVNSGGRLFINAAPNEGGNINCGFNGTVINYSAGPYSSNAVAVNTTDPVFQGPYTPVATSYSGGYFAHAGIIGTGLTNVLSGNTPSPTGTVVLAYKKWGAGVVFFGTATQPPFWSPQPQAFNLWYNIFSYVSTIPTVTVNCSVTGTTFCTAMPVTLTVNYTISGTFNAGNIFTAQLSNASGSFAAPLNIGSVTAVTNGVINATLPAGTPTGNGYRIRVVGSSPPAVGTSNGTDLQINSGAAPSLSISADNPNIICAGTPVTFTATPVNGGPAPSYQWKKNGSNVGANSNSYSDAALVNGDNIYCMITGNAACASTQTASSNSITFNVASIPNGGITNNTGSTILTCNTASIGLTATGGDFYQWDHNLGANPNVSITTPGIYTVLVASANGCAVQQSITITQNTTIPGMPFAITGSASVCGGGTYTYTIAPVSGATGYTWFAPVNSTIISGQGTTSIQLQFNYATGSGYLSVQSDNNGCTSNTGRQLLISYTSPYIPHVNIVSNTPGAVCAGNQVNFTATTNPVEVNASYQWKKNGINVGSNSNTYSDATLANNDVITCELTSSAACIVTPTATSNAITMIVQSITPQVTPTNSCTGSVLVLNTAAYTPALITWQLNGATVQSLSNLWLGSGTIVAGGSGGTALNQLSGPTGIFKDGAGNLYVTDRGNSRVLKYTSGSTTGVIVAGGNGSGSALNQLGTPLTSYVDASGNVYVSEYSNNRVTKWAPGATSGIVVAGGNGAGNTDNKLNGPHTVFVDYTGNVYVSDQSNHRVQRWAPNAVSGVTVAGGNGAGASANQITQPQGIFVDQQLNIYIADLGNSRIQKWATGASAGTTVAGGNGQGQAQNQLNTPIGVWVDKSGAIYIADYNNQRIQRWLPGATIGTTMVGGNGAGPALNQLSGPLALNVDETGLMYVVEEFNNRAMRFTPTVVTNQYTTLAPGNYTATVYTFAGCTFTSPTITIIPAMTAAVIISANPGNTICSGSTVSFTAIATNAGQPVSYQWKKNGNNVGANSNTYTDGAILNADIITCVITTNQECVNPTAASNAITMIVNPLPVATIINNAGSTVLNCTTTAISVTAAGGATYAWDHNLGTGAAKALNFPGTYTVTVTSAEGCSSQATITITQNIGIPVTPLTVSGPVNVCPFIGSGQTLTYSVTQDPVATSYLWAVPSTVTIISGQGTNSIHVTINAGFIANANKIIKVRGISDCGSSGDKFLYLLAQLPVTPLPIVASVTNVCTILGSNSTITYTIPNVTAASSYLWTTQAGNTTVTHPNGPGINDTIVQVSFTNNFTSSFITVQSVNDCGTSNVRSLAINRNNPSTPGLITGSNNACPYTAPGGIAIIYSVTPVANAISYTWNVPAGALSITGQGTNSISFIYPAGYMGGSISVTATNGCGTSAPRTMAISSLNPATPSVMDVIEMQSCPNRIYSYTLSAMPNSATSVQWTVPAGAMILSGQGLSSITVSYPSTAVSGFVTATSINNCGNSATRQSIVKLPACPPGYTGKSSSEKNSNQSLIHSTGDFTAVVFPNPSINNFTLKINAPDQKRVVANVRDLQGRKLKEMILDNNVTTNFGNELRPGTYILEILQGDKKIVERLIKL